MLVFCPICGKQYECGDGNGRFCSGGCKHKYDSEKRKEYMQDYIPPNKPPKEKTPKKCAYCGIEFIPEGRSDQLYHSPECQSKAKALRKWGELTDRSCPICEKIFTPTRGKQTCCSPKCTLRKIYLKNPDKKRRQAKEWRLSNPERVKENDRRKKENNPELYKQIEQRNHDKTRFSGNKAIALERDGYKCRRCGATDDLAMHHIDGSGQTEHPNNELDNLETICDSCHTKHHTPRLNTTPHILNNCQYCGKEIRVSQARVDYDRGKFCSRECADKGKIKQVTLICEHCGIEFSVTPSRLKRGVVKYHNLECRKAAGYAWTKYSRTEYNEQKALQ